MQKLSLILFLKFHQEYSILAPVYNNCLCIKNIQKNKLLSQKENYFVLSKNLLNSTLFKGLWLDRQGREVLSELLAKLCELCGTKRILESQTSD